MRRTCANLEPGDSATVRAVVGELALVCQALCHPAQLWYQGLGSKIKEQNMIDVGGNPKKDDCLDNAEKAQRSRSNDSQTLKH